MAQLPYYALNQGNLQLQHPQEVVDEYAPLREGLSQAQKYFEQKEAVEASKIMSKARSDWSIRMNEMQQQAGLDYEGFSENVNQGLQDYENEVINSVPYSQREKFSADFAGLKYDMLNKAGAYEVTASAEKIKLDVEEIQNNWGNVILSDPSQYEAGRADISEMIDGLQVADSVKEALRKEAFNGLAVSQVNALTNINPDYLLNQLKGGAFDSVLDPKQKYAAMNQATNKIKSNKLEVEKRQKDIINETYRNDFLLINDGVTDIDFEKMISNPVYKNDQEKILKLKKAFNDYRDSEQNDLQTVIDMEEGLLVNPDATNKKRLDYAFERLSKELGDYTQFESSAQTYAEKTNYIPRAFVGKINNMFNSSDPKEREVAAKSWYNVKMNNPQATSSMSDSQSDLLFAYGAGLHQNISLGKLKEQLGIASSDNVIKDREKKLKGIAEKGIKLDLDVEDIVAKQKGDDIFSAWYMQTGEESVAREMAENWVNSNYGITRIGLGKSQPGYLFDTSALYDWTYPEKEIYQPAELMYSVKDLDEDKNILWLADDLLMTAREVVPDIKYEDIRYTNDLMYDESNKPIYLMTNKDGVILGRWKPDYVNYRKKKKDLENK